MGECKVFAKKILPNGWRLFLQNPKGLTLQAHKKHLTLLLFFYSFMEKLLSIKPVLEALKNLNVLNDEDIKHANRFFSASIVFVVAFVILILSLIVHINGKDLINSYRKRYTFHNKYLFPVYLEPILIRLFIGLLRIASVLSIWIVFIGLSYRVVIVKDLFFAVLICTITFLFTRYSRKLIVSNKSKAF